MKLYIGSMGDTPQQKLSLLEYDPQTGRIVPIAQYTDSCNPSYITIDRQRRLLYTVQEADNTSGGGKLLEYKIIDDQGRLQLLSTTDTDGDHPCHITVDSQSGHKVVSNYGSGSLAFIKDTTTGERELFPFSGKGPKKDRQASSHIHWSLHTHGFWYATDLGSDSIEQFVLQNGSYIHLQSYKLPPGCGPRTLVVHPKLPILYLSCELSNEIYALEIGPGGELSLKYRYLSSHLSADPSGIENFASEVLIHPNGKVLYVANRGPNTITEYRIQPESGQLSLNQEISSQWHWPRSISLSKSGEFLFCCNRLSHRISLFRVGEQGSIQALEVTIHAQYPSCVVEL